MYVVPIRKGEGGRGEEKGRRGEEKDRRDRERENSFHVTSSMNNYLQAVTQLQISTLNLKCGTNWLIDEPASQLAINSCTPPIPVPITQSHAS